MSAGSTSRPDYSVTLNSHTAMPSITRPSARITPASSSAGSRQPHQLGRRAAETHRTGRVEPLADGKSGIGGGIVTVSPGKGGLGTLAPRLDAAGNSVKGQLAARFLSELDLLASQPAGIHTRIAPSPRFPQSE